MRAVRLPFHAESHGENFSLLPLGKLLHDTLNVTGLLLLVGYCSLRSLLYRLCLRSI